MWKLIWPILQQVRFGLGLSETMGKGRVQTLFRLFKGEKRISGASGLSNTTRLAIFAPSVFICYLTVPEKMGCTVPGPGLGRCVLECGPFGTRRGVFDMDIIS